MNFLHKLPKADPCSVTQHSPFLTFLTSSTVILFKCFFMLVMCPTDNAKILRSLTEPGTEKISELAFSLLINRGDFLRDICLPPTLLLSAIWTLFSSTLDENLPVLKSRNLNFVNDVHESVGHIPFLCLLTVEGWKADKSK